MKQIADTGDILLFKSSSFVTKVQRTITRSEYDHVAMLLRFSNGKLVIFESTGQTVLKFDNYFEICLQGVGVLNWDNFTKNEWHSAY